MKKEKTFEETAREIAKPYLSNPVNKVIYVNDKGLVWINNEPDQMEEMFARRNEKYITIENFGVEAPKEQPEVKKPKGKK